MMTPEEFAARRRAQFNDVDDLLATHVEKALIRYGEGEADWFDDLVKQASEVWQFIYKDESPHADPEGRRFDGFVTNVTAALERTSAPDDPPSDAQIERVTKWLGTYVVNDATWNAAGARGVRQKRWTTMHDNDVRDTHVATDGQVRLITAPFNVGGYELRFPGDPVGPPEIWINCRCVVQPAAQRGDAAVTPTTFAIVDDEDIAVETVDDDELPNDDLDDDEEEITEIPVHGVLAPEGVPTGDGRQFGEGALTNRELPLPIAYQLMSAEGHSNSVTVGRIDEVFREGNEMRFRGALVLTKEHTPAVIEGIVDGTVRGISVDVDDVEVDMSVDDSDGMDGKMPLTVFSHARIAGVTIVPIPAFQEAFIALGHEFLADLPDEAKQALAACGCNKDPDDDENPDIELAYDAFGTIDVSDDEWENWRAAAEAEDGAYRDVSTEERKRLAGKGAAMPDGSFPIANCQDLQNAIQAIGRAKDPAAVKAHIKRRKSALGCPDVSIPEGWAEETITAAAGTHDGPGWITHPIPTSRIRRYWVHGKGAAKIRWGVPGDFNRCRRQLAKYVKNPAWLAGTCANMHKEALGIWPGMETGRHALVASGEPAPIFNFVAAAVRVFDSNLFARVELDDPRVGIEVDGDHVYGYMAQWGVCHIGISGVCTEAPPSQTDYWYYATGVVDTTEGPVHVGQITMDTGHAPLRANAKVAAAHYDNTGAAVADVAVGEDAFGIWFSGVLRPTITDDQLHALRASGRISGDWRTIGGSLEMVAGLVVNVPGLPIPHVMVASADGVQTALVAAGVVTPSNNPSTPVATFSEMDAEALAGLVRTAVAEYRHAEKREARVIPLRDALRQKRIETLRVKIKE